MFTLNSCRQLLTSVLAKDVADGYLKVAKYSSLTLGARYGTRFSHQSCVKRSIKQCHLNAAAGRMVPKRHCSEMMIEPKRGLQEKKEEDNSPAGHSSKFIQFWLILNGAWMDIRHSKVWLIKPVVHQFLFNRVVKNTVAAKLIKTLYHPNLNSNNHDSC